MKISLCLRFKSDDQWLKVGQEAGWIAQDPDNEQVYLAIAPHEVTVIGELSKPTGATTTDENGIESQVFAPVPGFHVNLISDDELLPDEVERFIVKPATPMVEFSGVDVLRQIAEEFYDDTTLIVADTTEVPASRPIGARPQLTEEQRAQRIALREAVIVEKQALLDAIRRRDAARDQIQATRDRRAGVGGVIQDLVNKQNEVIAEIQDGGAAHLAALRDRRDALIVSLNSLRESMLAETDADSRRRMREERDELGMQLADVRTEIDNHAEYVQGLRDERDRLRNMISSQRDWRDSAQSILDDLDAERAQAITDTGDARTRLTTARAALKAFRDSL